MPKRPSSNKTNKPATPTAAVPVASRRWLRPADWIDGQIFWPSLASALALWAAFAPVGWHWLAWFAPVGWISVAARPGELDRRSYFNLWLAGCVFWLGTLQGIRLAFWPLTFGWIALSLYLAIYVPLFIATTRVLRSRGLGLVLAAPTAWVAFEMVRSYLLTGFSANMLAHTQAPVPIVLQIADQLGGYGVSFVVMAAAVAVYESLAWWRATKREHQENHVGRAVIAGGVAGGLLMATLLYGGWRLRQADELNATRAPLLRVLLVQENTPSMFDADPASIKPAWTRYLNQTRSTAAAGAPVDLVVWPESTFTGGWPWLAPDLPEALPPDLAQRQVDEERLREWSSDSQQEFAYKIELLRAAACGFDAAPGWQADLNARGGKTPSLLIGSDAIVIGSDAMRRFNSALFVDAAGQLAGRYDKMHLVMFGEYIPLGPLLAWLGDMFGFSRAEAGTEPQVFQVGESKVSANICFESAMPRLIRDQVAELSAAGNSPDVLINITNDSWFRGSAILDHHFACSVICAVENRRPLLIAANTGISAELDGCGRVVQALPKSAAGGLVAEPYADGRPGLVQLAGYPLGWICCVLSALAWVASRRFGVRKRS